jgi:cyclopropane-fatty-acyl-phospholipid synthase
MEAAIAPQRVTWHACAPEVFGHLLAPLDIRINGPRPWDIRIFNDAFYTKALRRGTEGILDAYVDGWRDCDQLDELVHRVMAGHVQPPGAGRLAYSLHELSARLLNLQSRRRALRVREHYDLGNDLFQAMLDRRMVYSCGYWKHAANLEDAQRAKLDLICRKMALRPGMRVLDIGCGWGAFAKYAAETYGASVVGITLSEEQCELGKQLCEGLPVELRLQDYRDLDDEPFDAVVSVGMFEHVGYKNYRVFMEIVRRQLKNTGLFLLHTIGANVSSVSGNPWVEHHIFPNGMLPSAKQITQAAEGLFVLEDWHGFGPDYDKTLLAWFENFDHHWPQLSEKYSPRFYRMWKCYLLSFAGSFRARANQVWQIVLSPSGVEGGYIPVR